MEKCRMPHARHRINNIDPFEFSVDFDRPTYIAVSIFSLSLSRFGIVALHNNQWTCSFNGVGAYGLLA